MKNWATAALCLLLVECRREIEVKGEPPPVIMVFADITDSLISGEPDEVRRAIFDIFDRAPELATVIVYPVVPEMAIVKALADPTISLRTGTGMDALQKEANERAALAQAAVTRLSEVGQKLQRRVPSSCLSGALRRAANDLTNFEGRRVEIVIISDMVEDCNRSVTGDRMQLNHRGIQAEILAVSKTNERYADLKAATVYFIYPAAIDSGVTVGRPRADPEELQAFWKAVLTRCNVQRVYFMAQSSSYHHDDWRSAQAAVEQLREGP